MVYGSCSMFVPQNPEFAMFNKALKDSVQLPKTSGWILQFMVDITWYNYS